MNNITVIICCAGMETRLGIGTTKALIDIDGKALVIRILEMLDNYDDVRIVVGYQAKKVIEVVKSYRKDIMFVFDYNYDSNTILDSIRKAIPYSKEYIVQIDGDLLIDPIDFKRFIEFPGECIGVNSINSENPIYANVENDFVRNFSLQSGNYEWMGLVKIKKSRLTRKRKYVYEAISEYLPMAMINVNSRDIDTYEDYEKALLWFYDERRKYLQ